MIDVGRFSDEYTDSMALIDKNIEQFMKINALNFQTLAEICAETTDKSQMARAFQAYFESYKKGSLNLIQGVRDQITESVKMVGGILHNVRELAPGIFGEEADDGEEAPAIGMKCVVRAEDGSLKEVSVDEVAAMLSDEELDKMEADLGAEAVKPFRDAKKKKEE